MKSFHLDSKLNRFALSLLFLVLTLSFQNCSKVKFLNTIQGKSESDSNGGVYGGKPTGTFYRFVPDFTCEGNEAPSAILEISDSKVDLTENKKLLCGTTKKQMDLSLIDSSIYQDQIVGYEEGIFEGKSEAPTKIPANLVEVWCKDGSDQNAIETITHFDREQNLAVTRIFYSNKKDDGTLQAQTIPDFTVARSISQKTLIVKDNNGFELTVHRDQPATQVGLFKANLKYLLNSQEVSRDTTCRLGGTIDPYIWPSKQVVDLNIVDLKASPDQQYFAYSAKTNDGVSNLFSVKVDGTSLRQVSPKLLSPGILDFNFTPDSAGLVYRGSLKLPDVEELFKVNLDGTSNLQLGEPLIDSNQAKMATTAPELKFTPDGKWVLYSDGSQDTNSGGAHVRLKAKSLSGDGAPIMISPPLASSVGSYGFSLSKQLNKVVFLQGSPTTPDLFSSNFDGTQVLNITPTSENWINWFDDLPISSGGNYVVIKTFGRNGGLQYAVALDGNGTIAIPRNWNWAFSDTTDTYAFLSSQLVHNSGNWINDESQTRIINLKNASLMSLPALQDPFFTKDSFNLVGSEISASGLQKPVMYSTTTGDRTELCPGISASHMKIIETEPNKYLIASHDSVRNILDIFVKNPTTKCMKVNSSVTIGTNLNKFIGLTISPDEQTILVHLEHFEIAANSQAIEYGNELHYIPLTGKPSMIVNSPTFEKSKISQAFFLPDSKTIFYMGEQIKPGVKNGFLWSPK